MIDPPWPCEIKCGTRRFDGLPDARQVDVDHVSPVVFTGLVESLSAVADSGVGADDVQPAELFDTAVHRRFESVVVTHVDLGGHDAPVQALDQVGGLGQVIRRRWWDLAAAADRSADVDRDDVGTLLRQAHRVTAALAASGAGDKRDLALNPSGHECTSSDLEKPGYDDACVSIDSDFWSIDQEG